MLVYFPGATPLWRCLVKSARVEATPCIILTRSPKISRVPDWTVRQPSASSLPIHLGFGKYWHSTQQIFRPARLYFCQFLVGSIMCTFHTVCVNFWALSITLLVSIYKFQVLVCSSIFWKSRTPPQIKALGIIVSNSVVVNPPPLTPISSTGNTPLLLRLHKLPTIAIAQNSLLLLLHNSVSCIQLHTNVCWPKLLFHKTDYCIEHCTKCSQIENSGFEDQA